MPSNDKKADEMILHAAVAGFAQFEPKFRRGMEVYDTTIIAKDPVSEAKQEVLDLWAYLHAAEYKQRRAHELVARAVMNYVLPPGALADLNEAIGLLRPRPLATKNPPKPGGSSGPELYPGF